VCPDPQNRSIFKEKAPAKLYGVFSRKSWQKLEKPQPNLYGKKSSKNTIQFGWGGFSETPR
jgi:hypothetical protein